MNRRSLDGAPLVNAVLPATFFQRPAAKVARDLLGKKLVRQQGSALTLFMIVETEAYEGAHDLASHSSRGRTPRTEVMFGPAGRFYVYRVYGLHWMLNIVAGDVGDAAAVLIRGLGGISGPGRVAPRGAAPCSTQVGAYQSFHLLARCRPRFYSGAAFKIVASLLCLLATNTTGPRCT